MSHSSISLSPGRRIQIPGMLQDTYPLQVLVDSGADDNFIDSGIISKLSIPTVELANSKEVLALDGRLLAEVTHRTAPITLTISGNHQETVELFVISSPLSPVLGLPWLKLHNPQIDWASVSITGWSNHCHSHCLGSAKTAFSSPSPSPAEEVDISSIPSEYHDLKLVFSKDRALSLPPHRPYDCAIELLPGAPLPTKKLYNLSRPEKEAMEKYIGESLSTGIIRPSSSPVGAGFFLCGQKRQVPASLY